MDGTHSVFIDTMHTAGPRFQRLIGVWLIGRGEVVEYYINKIEFPHIGSVQGEL